MGKTLPDNSYVDLNQVGNNVNGTDSIQCHTDLISCCGYENDGGGEWFSPARNRLPVNTTDIGIYKVYQDQRIDLRRSNTGDYSNIMSGIYQCQIQTKATGISGTGNQKLVNVGLYTSGGILMCVIIMIIIRISL